MAWLGSTLCLECRSPGTGQEPWGVCPSHVSVLLLFLPLSPSCGGWVATGLRFMSHSLPLFPQHQGTQFGLTLAGGYLSLVWSALTGVRGSLGQSWDQVLEEEQLGQLLGTRFVSWQAPFLQSSHEGLAPSKVLPLGVIATVVWELDKPGGWGAWWSGGCDQLCLEVECCFLAEGKRGQGHSEQRNTFNFYLIFF